MKLFIEVFMGEDLIEVWGEFGVSYGTIEVEIINLISYNSK